MGKTPIYYNWLEYTVHRPRRNMELLRRDPYLSNPWRNHGYWGPRSSRLPFRTDREYKNAQAIVDNYDDDLWHRGAEHERNFLRSPASRHYKVLKSRCGVHQKERWNRQMKTYVLKKKTGVRAQ